MKVKIGELAKKTGCQVVTIRYYEKEGLLRKPDRSGGNYRLYDDKDIERLKFIRHCRKHDMKLAEIRNLLSYRDNSTKNCTWVSELIDTHINNVEAQIQSLMGLKTYLRKLRTKCAGGNSADSCGIMKSLNNMEACGCATDPPR